MEGSPSSFLRLVGARTIPAFAFIQLLLYACFSLSKLQASMATVILTVRLAST